MMKKNRKGFTLIELIAVLVILAIIALIVTLLVLNIIKKAKESANKRSIDTYGKAVGLAVATYLLDNGDYPNTLDNLTIEYSGNKVNCQTIILNEDGSIYLTRCSVAGIEVKDARTDDGYYHYGKISNEILPLTGNYYRIGDEVTYNGIDFYVIENSDETMDSITLLKAEPLTVDEVNTYGEGHVNVYAPPSYPIKAVGTAYDENGYGGMTYYTSETCGYPPKQSAYGGVYYSLITTGCTTDYDASEIKYVVDNWSMEKLNQSDLQTDSLGYTARLLTYDELINNLGYSKGTQNATSISINKEYTPKWVYNSSYWYWTMSAYNDSNVYLWEVGNGGHLSNLSGCIYARGVVRPVVTILKSAL